MPVSKLIRRATLAALVALAVGATDMAGLGGGEAQAAGLVPLAIDQATVLRLSRPAGTIILGNPLIADASVQDAETLVLTGRSFGITNIIVLDANGDEVLNTQLTVRSSGSSSHIVTVHRATARSSFSCTPECETAPPSIPCRVHPS
ncbi:MAG: pilus assembly protein N-terminal domain-containing protein [Pseudomonadota bacterium]